MSNILIDWQPKLEDDLVLLEPLEDADFEDVYEVASDPLVWAMHPNKNRYERQIFQVYFEGAIKSNGAFKIILKKSQQIIGCTRFYDYSPDTSSVFIGYTFYGVDQWGKGINPRVKKIMLEYAFQFVKTIYFHVGAENYRSMKAIERLGASKIKEEEVSYFGEPVRKNVLYALRKLTNVTE